MTCVKSAAEAKIKVIAAGAMCIFGRKFLVVMRVGEITSEGVARSYCDYNL
jgi:hypothetical protein